MGVTALASQVVEGGTVTLRFSRSALLPGNADLPTPVSYTVTGVAASDISGLAPSGTVIIPQGVGYHDVPVTINRDLVVEGTESLTITLGNDGFQLIPDKVSATVQILDNYSTVEVEATDAYASEIGPNPGKFRIIRTGNIGTAITVLLRTNGTARAVSDYTPSIGPSITLAAGEASKDIVVNPSDDGIIEAAKTVVLNLLPSHDYVLGANTNAVVVIGGEGPSPFAGLPSGEMYVRGSGAGHTNHSVVFPLNGLKGRRRLDVENSGFPTLYHRNETNAASQMDITGRIAFNTPIASFGRQWKEPLFVGQTYHIGFFAGNPTVAFPPIKIMAYRLSDGGLEGTWDLALPSSASSGDWNNFVTNGFSRATNGYGLTTTLRAAPDLYWKVNGWGTYLVSHQASHEATNYTYRIEAKGWSGTLPMVLDAGGQAVHEPLYTLDFEIRPANRSLFLDRPHFEVRPLPPHLQGKTPDELLNYGAVVGQNVSLATNGCMSLDQSPELRRHPILDQFVSDLNSDPLALANYVFNEIGLTDAIAYPYDGVVTNESINVGGVNRSALGVYLEGQGSPIEQCALLVYLMRQAGYPAAYVFPPDGGLKMLDSRISQLLRLRVTGAQNEQGQLFTTNRLITVNYPWVAVHINGQWTHLFPWLKDIQITEGFSIYDFLPQPYNNGQMLVKDYILGKTNLLALADPGNDTLSVIFPRFLRKTFEQSAPGLSLDDFGVKCINRRHLYGSLDQFPRPTWVTNTSTAVESLSSSGITSVSPSLTNIFDTVSFELWSAADPNKKIATPELRTLDLHNRKLFVSHTDLGNGEHQAQLRLGAFRTNATGLGSFAAADVDLLLNRQVATLNLNANDDQLVLRTRHRRLRTLSLEQAIDPYRVFLGVAAAREIADERPLRKGDVAAICMHFGRVTPAMLRVHAEELWNMERQLNTNSSAAGSISVDVYQGTLTYLMGMSYHERVGRFDEWNRQLHKVQNLSSFAVGLAKLGPRRDTNTDLLVSTGVDPIWPNVDMFSKETINVANGSIRPDSGWSFDSARRDYAAISIADGSAQEHQILNSYFGRSNAVSTVKLLQLAGSSGIVELTYYNYQSEGDKVIPGTNEKKLKELNPGIWASVVSAFSVNSADALYSIVWITSNKVSAPGFSDTAALILSPTADSALIGANQRGGYADKLPQNNLISAANTPQYEARVDSDGDYQVSLVAATTASKTQAAASTPDFDLNDWLAKLVSGAFYPDPQQQLQAAWTGQSLNAVAGNFADTAAQAADRGVNGKPTWWQKFKGTVSDPVNSVTGEFYVDETDLSLPGPMSLQMRRNYGSQNLSDNQLGFGWKLSYMPFLTLATNNVIHASEPDGSIIAFEKIGSTDIWAPSTAANPELDNYSTRGIGSIANVFNARIAKALVGTTNVYYLTNSSGSLRVFEERQYPIGGVDRKRPYLTEWYDNQTNFYSFEYGTDQTALDYGQVRRIVSSSGSVLRFSYDVYGRIVDAYSLDGRRVSYDYDEYGDLVTVTRADGSQIRFEYEQKMWTTNSITNVYSTHLIIREIKPDGRILENMYDDQRRVTNQSATVGADLRLVRNAVFIYTNDFKLTNFTATLTGSTTIIDYTNNATTFYYTNSLISRIRDPLGQEIIQEWYQANEATPPAYPRSLKKMTDKRGLVSEYLYDARGNLTNTIVTGDLLGDGATVTAKTVTFFNDKNLPEKSILPNGTTNFFFYTNTWLLAEQVVWPSNATGADVITNRHRYHSVSDEAAGLVSHGLRQSEIRAAGSSDATTNEWTHDARGFVATLKRMTGTDDPAVVITNFHNYRGELVAQTNAAGRVTRYAYDPRGSLQAREVFESEQAVPLAWDYFYYNENGEPTWTDGPRYNPEDYKWRDYDGAGRLTTEMRWRSQAKFDGSGVEAPVGDSLYSSTLSEYDPFGNLVRSFDARGNYVTNRYDAIGQLLETAHYNAAGTPLTTNRFAYEPGGLVRLFTNAMGGVTEKEYTKAGKLKLQKNPDGSTNGWRYYADGRLQREYLRNGNYWETVYEDAVRRVTRTFKLANGGDFQPLTQDVSEYDRRGNLLRQINAEGHSFTNRYDGLDRLKIWTGPSSFTSARQARTNYYDAAGVVFTSENALKEKSVTYFDALGRTVTNDVLAADGTRVRRSVTLFSPDHQSVTNILGTEGNAIKSVTFTDTFGNPVLSQQFPTDGSVEFARNAYDAAGNLLASWDELQQMTWFDYDGLNRLASKVLPDGKRMTLAYDAAGNLTNRTMAESLTWAATYDSAGRMLSEKLNNTARIHQYSYYPANAAAAGLLKNVVDPRSITTEVTYDALLRVQSRTSTGDLPEHYLEKQFAYDRLGHVILLTQLTDPYQLVSVERYFDAYGQQTWERQHDFWHLIDQVMTQEWDGAGRRAFLRGNPGISSSSPYFSHHYEYRADGLMTKITIDGMLLGGEDIYEYDYADNGLLTSRAGAGRTSTVSQRDGRGRPKQMTTTVAGSTIMAETMSWRANSTLEQYGLARTGTGTWDETRDYLYNSRGQLTRETFAVGPGSSVRHDFGFDVGGLGVRTSVEQSDALANWWKVPDGQLSLLGRIMQETTKLDGLKLRAHGMAYFEIPVAPGLTSIRATSGSPTGLFDGRDNVALNYDSETKRWFTDLNLTPGEHTLTVTAYHNNGQYTIPVPATSVFTVANQGVTENTYDAAGNLVSRSLGGGRVQTLTWDADGRLIKVKERNVQNNGYDWWATYDGLGRRLHTGYYQVQADLQVTGSRTETQSFFDPMVEFQEIIVQQNLWMRAADLRFKIYGPDASGVFGGLQGVGGLEALIKPGYLYATNIPPFLIPVWGEAWGTVNDHLGDMVGWVKDGEVKWNTVPVTGYGVPQGYEVPKLSLSQPMEEATHWRGRRADPTGFYWVGARHYDGLSGRFLSPDPLGHESSWDLYSYANGDPINYLDANGRWTSKGLQEVMISGQAAWNSGFGLGDAMRDAGGVYNEWGGGSSSVALNLVNNSMGTAMNMGGGIVTGESYAEVYRTTVDRASTVMAREMVDGSGSGWTVAQGASSIVGDFAGYNQLYEGGFGVDRHEESLLGTSDRWSRGLMGGSSLILGATGLGATRSTTTAAGSGGGGLKVARFDYPNLRPRQGGLLKGDNLAHPGAADEIMVIGRRVDTAADIGKEGHNVLNTKLWDIHVNDGWTMRGIREGRTFKLATEPSFSSLRRSKFLADGTYIRDTTVFFKELKMLRDAGYVRKGNLMMPGGQ